MGNSLIPLSTLRSPTGSMASSSPIMRQAKLRYKPTFRPRKNATSITAAEDSEVHTSQSESDKLLGCKVTPAAYSPIASKRYIDTDTEGGYPMPTTPATTPPASSNIVRGSDGYMYTMPKREQLTCAPPLRIVGAPQLRVQMPTPVTSLPISLMVDVHSGTHNDFTVPDGRVQRAASVPPSSPPPETNFDGVNYNGYTRPKREQLTCSSQLVIQTPTSPSCLPVPSKTSLGSGIPIKHRPLTYTPHLQTTGGLRPTVQKATPISQSVVSEGIELDNGVRDGHATLEYEQPTCAPCIPVNDESRSMIPKALLLHHPERDISDTESEITTQYLISEDVLPVKETAKETTAIKQTEETSNKTTIVVEGNKEKPKGKRTGSDLEARDEELREEMHDVELVHEQMDSSEEGEVQSVRKILEPKSHNAAAAFRPQTLAAWNTLNLAINQAIHILHSNPTAEPATSQMVLDFLGSAIIGHAILREGLQPKAIQVSIDNLLVRYHKRQAEKAVNSARLLRQLELGFEIGEFDMLDYGMDDAGDDPENYVMEGMEVTEGDGALSHGLKPFLPIGVAPAASVSTSTCLTPTPTPTHTDFRFVEGYFEIYDEVMEESKNSTAQVLRMLEYGDTDDSEMSQSTRSDSPELTTSFDSGAEAAVIAGDIGKDDFSSDSGIVMSGVDIDHMESIEELSLFTGLCMGETPGNVDDFDKTGFDDIQYLGITEAGDFIMTESTEVVDSVSVADIIMKTDCIQNMDDTEEFESLGGSYDIEGLSGTVTLDRVGENIGGKTDSTGEPDKINNLLMPGKDEKSEDPGAIEIFNHPTKEVDGLSSSNCVRATHSEELDTVEELSVTEDIDTSGSGHIGVVSEIRLPLDMKELEGCGVMSSPEGFENPVSLDETVVNAVCVAATAQISNFIAHNDEKVVKFLDAGQIMETVLDADTNDIDSSIGTFGGVEAAGHAEFPSVPGIIDPLEILSHEDAVPIEGPESVGEAVIMIDFSCSVEKVEGALGMSVIDLDVENMNQELEGENGGQCDPARNNLELSSNPEAEIGISSDEELDSQKHNSVEDLPDVDGQTSQIDITQILGVEMEVYLNEFSVSEKVKGIEYMDSSGDKPGYIVDSRNIEEAPGGGDISKFERIDHFSPKQSDATSVDLDHVEGPHQEIRSIVSEQVNLTTKSSGICSQSERERQGDMEEYSEDQIQESENSIQCSTEYADSIWGDDDVGGSVDEDIDERVGDWIARLPNEAEALEEWRKEEKERKRTTADNIKGLALICASSEVKQKSWEGFIHLRNNQILTSPQPPTQAPTPSSVIAKAPTPIEAPAPAAVGAPTPIVVVTVIPKDITTPTVGTGNYIWRPIFPFICISALLAASGPAAILDRFQSSASTLGLSGIQSETPILSSVRQTANIFASHVGLQEVSLFLLLIWISLCWRPREAIKTNVSHVVREIIGLVWSVISCTVIGLQILYTSGMDWINALRFASVRPQPTTNSQTQVSKPEPGGVTSGEKIILVRWNNNTDDESGMSASLYNEFWKGMVTDGVMSSLLPSSGGSTMPGLSPLVLGEMSPRYILSVGGGGSERKSDAGVVDVGVGTLGLGLISLLMVGGGGRRRQLRRGGGRR